MKIMILNTGGTISCRNTASGYTPDAAFIEEALTNMPALRHHDMPEVVLRSFEPLLDSANMTMQEWNIIASTIYDNHDDFDGFVILHGTDTMAYTASALSFMLENLDKPVILTGSQIPLSEVRNDSYANIITAIWLCTKSPIREVCIYFNEVLLRGNRAQKVSSERFRAFDSPNLPHLVHIGINLVFDYNLLLQPKTQHFNLQLMHKHFIANFRLFPGFSTEVLEYILNSPIKGLILETYGSGTAQNNDAKFLQLLTDACARGVVIVACTQCQHGAVYMDSYATSVSLKKAGVISGHDMTLEAAHCKLLYLFSKYDDIVMIKNLMATNVCGELT
jgi:L-asparaginase